MANQELVAYFRKHWKQYGSDALRNKLLEEGLDENEVNAALAEAAPKSKTKVRKPLYLFIAVVVLIIFVIWIFESGPEDTQQQTLASKQPPVRENLNDPHQAFMGHYGYVIRLPLGYEALSNFKDPEKTIEQVYLFPKGTDLNNLPDERIYAALGILRLEVRPQRVPLGHAGLAVVRDELINSLQQSKLTYSLRETMVDGLQAVVVSIQGPRPQVRAYVIGSKVLYTLTGGAENQILVNTLLSLHELSPNDKPGSL